MRGAECEQSSMFSYISAERRVPKDHPLRVFRAMADAALKRLDQRCGGMYGAMGRPSIPPERLLHALLLQVLYSLCSEQLPMEQLDYNSRFRCRAKRPTSRIPATNFTEGESSLTRAAD
jgi:transposase